LGGDHQVGVAGLAAAVLTLAAAFFFGFPAACLVAALDLRLGFFRSVRIRGGGHFRLLGRLRDWLTRGIWIRGWYGGRLDDSPSRTT
jgi:hypothetical protein